MAVGYFCQEFIDIDSVNNEKPRIGQKEGLWCFPILDISTWNSQGKPEIKGYHWFFREYVALKGHTLKVVWLIFAANYQWNAPVNFEKHRWNFRSSWVKNLLEKSEADEHFPEPTGQKTASYGPFLVYVRLYKEVYGDFLIYWYLRFSLTDWEIFFEAWHKRKRQMTQK